MSTTGSDANSGTIDAPLHTITAAARLAQPGTTILVRSGTYTNTVSISNSGTAYSNIVVQPYPGESVTLDGSLLPAKTDLVSISGNYIQFKGFNVQNSPGHGIVAYADTGVQIVGNTIHGSYSNAIWVGGDSIGQSHNNLIQGNTVYNNVLMNQGGTNGAWSQGITADISDNTTITGNTVYGNYGEGIGSQYSSGVAITGNTVHDNYSVNIYLDNAPNSFVNSNFIYSTGNSAFFIKGHAADGIIAAEETGSIQRPLTNLVITNNVDVGDRSGFYYGAYGQGGGMQNALIANNTFVNNTGEAINLDPSSGNSGNRVVNNIFERQSAGTLATGSASDAAMSNNLWFGGSAGSFAGAGDVNADPQLASAGSLSASGYHLSSTSPALGAGAALSQVTADMFGAARVYPFSIGAAQS